MFEKRNFIIVNDGAQILEMPVGAVLSANTEVIGGMFDNEPIVTSKEGADRLQLTGVSAWTKGKARFVYENPDGELRLDSFEDKHLTNEGEKVVATIFIVYLSGILLITGIVGGGKNSVPAIAAFIRERIPKADGALRYKKYLN